MFIVFFTMSFCFQLSQMEIFHKSMKLHWDNFRETEESFLGGINMHKIGQLSYSAVLAVQPTLLFYKSLTAKGRKHKKFKKFWQCMFTFWAVCLEKGKKPQIPAYNEVQHNSSILPYISDEFTQAHGINGTIWLCAKFLGQYIFYFVSGI